MADEQYDPGEYTVDEVTAYLAAADDVEHARVFDAERAGKGRVGILDLAPFDPAEHTVDEVNEHLETAEPGERDRVLAAETAGKARKGVLERNAEPGAEQAPHSSFVDAAHQAAGQALGLAEDLEKVLTGVIDDHAAVIAEHASAPGEEAVWQAHNRVGFALTDMARPIAALRATATDVRNETSNRGAVDAPEDDS